ncbi:MAG: hypothetical protein M1835_004224 [Candelina submexicana]|nr:MAG: hypothetical protein M1835_004224 [Candelina submexicana]
MAPEARTRKRKAGATSETAVKKVKHVKPPEATPEDPEEETRLQSVINGKEKNHNQTKDSSEEPNHKKEVVEVGTVAFRQSQADSDAEEDDQTEALLKGFESSDDNDASGDEGYQKGQEVPSVPANEKLQGKLKGARESNTDSPGIIYVGRIPHGFYEHEMRAYFSQFGDIRRLRLSRNRKTGHSKHYAFIEFKSLEVAQIVADTMDNYLMFGHILKCKIVPREQVHEKLWKGANKRFKKVPWNRLEGRALNKGKTREEWNKKIVAETQSRKEKQDKLKAIGYDFEPPALKPVEDVPKQDMMQPLLGDMKITTDEDQNALAKVESAEVEAPTAGTEKEEVMEKEGGGKPGSTQAETNAGEAETQSATPLAVRESVKAKKGKKAKRAKKPSVEATLAGGA